MHELVFSDNSRTASPPTPFTRHLNKQERKGTEGVVFSDSVILAHSPPVALLFAHDTLCFDKRHVHDVNFWIEKWFKGNPSLSLRSKTNRLTVFAHVV